MRTLKHSASDLLVSFCPFYRNICASTDRIYQCLSDVQNAECSKQPAEEKRRKGPKNIRDRY